MNKPSLFLLLVLFTAACSADRHRSDASGVFETTETVVSASQGGTIVAFTPNEGEELSAGAVVGAIDSTQFVLQRNQLRATLSATAAHRLDATQQVAEFQRRLAHVQTECTRFEQLVADDAAPRKQLDDLRQQRLALESQIAARSEQLEANNRSVSGQTAAVAAQVAQLDDHIRRCRIVAPATGSVLVVYARRGEFATPGRPLFKMANLRDIYLRAYVTADQLTALRLGQPVTVYADQGRDARKAYRGTLSWISDRAEFTPKTIQTRDERANLVYAIKVRVANDGLIKRGMYGEVSFTPMPLEKKQ